MPALAVFQTTLTQIYSQCQRYYQVFQAANDWLEDAHEMLQLTGNGLDVESAEESLKSHMELVTTDVGSTQPKSQSFWVSLWWESTSHLGTKALPGAWFQPGLGPGPGVQDEVSVSRVRDAAQRELRGQAGRLPGRGVMAGERLEVRRWASDLSISAPFLRGHG